MEFKGTKGKWRINNTGFQIVNEDNMALCDVWSFNKSKEESEANVKLIASAPEMFEMLKKIRDEKVSEHYFEIEKLLTKITE